MDIGTAKPSAAVRGEIPHHLIDVVEPSESFSAATYVSLAEQSIADIRGRGRPVFLVGGTILYLKALTEGMFEGPSADPEIRARLDEIASTDGLGELHRRLQQVDPVAAQRIHPNDRKRIIRALEVHELTGQPISALQAQWGRDGAKREFTMIGLRRDREDQNHRTNQRVIRMIQAGLVDEVRSLLAEPIPLSDTARKAVGYAEIIKHLQGEFSLEHAIETIKINTRQFAKSQRTWLRRFRDIRWLVLEPDAEVNKVADRLRNEPE